MILLVDRPQILPADVRLKLCGGDVGMPEHFLDRAQIRSPLQQVRSERVAEGVRRDVFRELAPLGVLPENLPRSHPGERLPPRIEEQLSLTLPALQPWAQLPNIDRYRRERAPPHWDEPLLAPL